MKLKGPAVTEETCMAIRILNRIAHRNYNVTTANGWWTICHPKDVSGPALSIQLVAENFTVRTTISASYGRIAPNLNAFEALEEIVRMRPDLANKISEPVEELRK